VEHAVSDGATQVAVLGVQAKQAFLNNVYPVLHVNATVVEEHVAALSEHFTQFGVTNE